MTSILYVQSMLNLVPISRNSDQRMTEAYASAQMVIPSDSSCVEWRLQVTPGVKRWPAFKQECRLFDCFKSVVHRPINVDSASVNVSARPNQSIGYLGLRKSSLIVIQILICLGRSLGKTSALRWNDLSIRVQRPWSCQAAFRHFSMHNSGT